MSLRTRLPLALLGIALLAAGCGGDEPQDLPTTPSVAVTTPSTPAPAPTGPQTFTTGEATVEVTGDVEATFTAAVDAEESTYDPEGETEHDLLFVDADGNALRVSVQVVDGTDEAPFIAVGLPGTSLFDENYFPDQFNSKCEVTLTTATPVLIEGSFECDDLERGDGEQTIDATGTFSAAV